MVIPITPDHKHIFCLIFAAEIRGLTEDSNLKEYKHECNEYDNRGEQAKGYSEESPVR